MGLDAKINKNSMRLTESKSIITTGSAIETTTGSNMNITSTRVTMKMISGNTVIVVNSDEILEVDVQIQNGGKNNVLEIILPEYVELRAGYTDKNDKIIGTYIDNLEVVINTDNTTTLRYKFLDSVGIGGMQLGLNIPIRIRAERVVTGDSFQLQAVFKDHINRVEQQLTLTAKNTQRYILTGIGYSGGLDIGNRGNMQLELKPEKKGNANLTRLTDAKLIIPLPDEVEYEIRPSGTYNAQLYDTGYGERGVVVTGFEELSELQKIQVLLECNNQIPGKRYKADYPIRLEYTLDERSSMETYELGVINLTISQIESTQLLPKQRIDVEQGATNTILSAVNIKPAEDMWNVDVKVSMPQGTQVRGFGINNAKLSLQDDLCYRYTTNKGKVGEKYISKTLGVINAIFTPTDLGLDVDEYVTELRLTATRLRKEFRVYSGHQIFFYGNTTEDIAEMVHPVTYEMTYNKETQLGEDITLINEGKLFVKPDKEIETPVHLKGFETDKALYQPGEVINLKSRMEVIYDEIREMRHVYKYEVVNPTLYYVIPEEFEILKETIEVSGVPKEKLNIQTTTRLGKNILTIEVKDTSIGGLNEGLRPLPGIMDISFDVRVSNVAKRGAYKFSNPFMWVEAQGNGFFDQERIDISPKVDDVYGLSTEAKLTASVIDINNLMDNLNTLNISRGRIVSINRAVKSEIDSWKDYIEGQEDTICSFKQGTSGMYRMVVYNGEKTHMENVHIRVELPKANRGTNEFTIQLGAIEISGMRDVEYVLSDGSIKRQAEMTEEDLPQVQAIQINIPYIAADEEVIIDVPLVGETDKISSIDQYASIGCEASYTQNTDIQYRLPEAKIKLIGNKEIINQAPNIEMIRSRFVVGEAFRPEDYITIHDDGPISMIKVEAVHTIPIEIREDIEYFKAAGTYTITYTAEDESEASSTQTFEIIVNELSVEDGSSGSSSDNVIDGLEEQEPLITTMKHPSYIQIYGDGSFRPDESVTRGQFITMLGRLVFEDEIVPDAKVKFKDITTTCFGARVINYFVSIGVVNGYEDNTFRPTVVITRAEVASIIQRLLDLEGVVDQSKEYIDLKKGHWAYDAIQVVAKKEYLIGNESNEFRASMPITRAEVVVGLNRIYRASCSEADIAQHIQLKDIQSDDWLHEEVLKASVAHMHEIIKE